MNMIRNAMFGLFLAVPSLAASTVASQAAAICKAIALHDVPAIEDPSSIIKRGMHDTAITQYRVDKKTGEASFCSHGGYCFPTHIIKNGTKVEALSLTNCKIGKRDPFDGDGFGAMVMPWRRRPPS